MTNVQSFIHGLYPRSAQLVATSRDFERKRVGQSALSSQQKKDSAVLLSLQKKYNFNFLEIGKVTWHDIFRPIVEASTGVKTGALTRWFDNNCFYRQPIITGKLSVNFTRLRASIPTISPNKKWKVTLPSPYTFAKLSEDTSTKDFKKTLENVTQLLVKITEDLAKRGVEVIQFNEPAAVYYQASKNDLLLLKHVLEKIAKKKKTAKIAVNFYFGDAKEAVKTLVNAKGIDIVGVDFYKTNLESLPKKVPFDIIAGVIDGRNSLLEDEKAVEKFLKEAVNHLSPENLFIANNSDLELLPEPVAQEKLKIIHRLQVLLKSS